MSLTFITGYPLDLSKTIDDMHSTWTDLSSCHSYLCCRIVKDAILGTRISGTSPAALVLMPLK
jgi:hypothetical protein